MSARLQSPSSHAHVEGAAFAWLSIASAGEDLSLTITASQMTALSAWGLQNSPVLHSSMEPHAWWWEALQEEWFPERGVAGSSPSPEAGAREA